MKTTFYFEPFGLPAPVPEWRFHPTRLWRLDWAWPDYLIGVEQDGGLWVSGRHSRGAGRLGDYEKDREAMVLGWRIGRFSPQEVKKGVAAEWVKRMIERSDLLALSGASQGRSQPTGPAFSSKKGKVNGRR